MNEAIHQYIVDLFAPEDDVLQAIRAAHAENDLPQINIDAHEGRLLQLLMHAIGARTAVEIGTLAGYSGTWIARALPPDGVLYTIEASAKHAAIARHHFERAGVADRVELIEGAALDVLPKLSARAPFDFIFIDADKPAYPDYLAWAVEHLRPGGMLTAHNTTSSSGGSILDNPESDNARAIQAFNRLLAMQPGFHSGIIAAGRGLAVGIKHGG
jgi:caffeoyl-CoA O-methyltransferase